MAVTLWLRLEMARQTLPIWALVIDSTRCRILRDLDAVTDDAPRELVLRAESRHLRDVIVERPGRRPAPRGAGHKPEKAYCKGLLAEDQRQFLGQAIAVLESHRRAGDFGKVVVVAEKAILGPLRQMLPQTIRERTILELPRNLVQLSARDLVDRIKRELTDGSQLS